MDSIKFLGTAGARFAVIQQIRKSGGIWLTLNETNILIDPGPGSLIRCLSSKPKLNPQNLDAIILSHRHIDHSNDINIMIEAMTNGGYNKKGTVFAPSDALETDPVILKHFRNHVENIITLKEKTTYHLNSISFSTSTKHIHDCETYGFLFQGSKQSIAYITDTKYFQGLESHYKADIVIINVVLLNPKDYINHLSVKDAEHIMQIIQPKTTILTHFGLTMIREKPWKIAESLEQKTGLPVIAASDGMLFPIDN
jgi:phosphoribosyl 1,2-cyclic phosphodiesterase